MPPVPANSERLVEILTDIVRSALAWEDEHGGPPEPDTSGEDGLTGIHRSIQCMAHKIQLNGGHQHDGDDTDEGQERPTTDV
jgi:hypothetical protein